MQFFVFQNDRAIALRINIPVAIVTSFVSNPLTMVPMYSFAYLLGSTILGKQATDIDFELSLNWVTDTFVQIWQPMMLGCLLLGFVTALIGFVVIDLLWRSNVRDYKSRKRNERNISD